MTPTANLVLFSLQCARQPDETAVAGIRGRRIRPTASALRIPGRRRGSLRPYREIVMGNSSSKTQLVDLLEGVKKKTWDTKVSARDYRRKIDCLSRWKLQGAGACIATAVLLVCFQPFGVLWSIVLGLTAPPAIFGIVWYAVPSVLQFEYERAESERKRLDEERQELLRRVKTTQVYEDAEEVLRVYDGEAFDVAVQL